MLVLAGIALTCGLPVCTKGRDPIACPSYLGPVLDAATDSTVILAWAPPEAEEPGFGCGRQRVRADSYSVWFMECDMTFYQLLGSTDSTEWVHDPAGKTGTYKVTAWFGDTSYAYDMTPSTVPLSTPVAVVAELNAPGYAGYGWDRTDGQGETCSMRDAASSVRADFYLSDFAAGFQGPAYFLASPHLGPGDPGEGVPAATWRVARFAAARADGSAPSPILEPQVWSDRLALDELPALVCCHAEDDYFAQVKVLDLNRAEGTTRLESWFQPVKGLRLLRRQ
jgi:hypothetical protein